MKKKPSPRQTNHKAAVKKPPSATVASTKIPANKKPKPFPIVGIGASAGGIEAFTELLKHLDSTLGMAYVLVMHLSPNHKSALKEIMQSKTKMPVHTVKSGMEVMANNVYVIPPKTFMSVVDGHLKLAPRSLTAIGNYAVDYFLTTLASIYKNNAIGVVLSGTATDGTLGLKAIKAEGGITFAQDDTAEFSGMPNNAYDSGYVDFLLPPEGIAKELARLVKVPYTVLPAEKIEAEQVKEIDAHSDELKKILAIVKNKSGIDFFHNYKQASIYRRVIRRMALCKLEKLDEYEAMLKTNPKEVDALYNDFLINVTNFFRDPEFFKTLTTEVFPAITKKRNSVDPIRLWVAGCATGEEAYSLAICLIEFLTKHNLLIPVQVFASDLDNYAIEKARLGIYSLSALQGVPQSYLKQYFTQTAGNFQVVKSLRERCIFSQHNLLKDPPFSRIDLISCQNVLIYLETSPQKKILQAFHYALKPTGFLFLGKSETIGTSSDLFESLDKKIKLYSRKQTKTPQLEFTVPTLGNISIQDAPLVEQPADRDVEKDMSKLMLARFVHPSVVVNKNLMIVQFFGVTSPYLSPATGKASFNILRMIREDLAVELRTLLQQARRNEQTVSKEGIQIYNKKALHEITIEVVPRKTPEDIFFLVVFIENSISRFAVDERGKKSNGTYHSKTILKLKDELTQSREVIRTTAEEYETTYEELQANNEEILSSNEELQSVNEELETSKEELQSSNEELSITNEELHKRNTELNTSQEELKKVNDQIQEFAFISSHDLQEPLRKIETFADLLSGPEADLNEYARKYANKINSSAARMSALVRDLLHFSLLINNGNRKLANVDLHETVESVIKDFEVKIESKKALITLSALPVVTAEPVQMNQLFHNLISNALKFSSEHPVITVSSRTSTSKDFITYPALKKGVQYVAIIVKDNGVGFDQQYVTKIFTLFQKLNDIKNTKGTGAGLALCKKIVDDHKGFIFAEGKINEGATFSVFLPAG